MSKQDDITSNRDFLFHVAQKLKASRFLFWLEDADASPEVLNREELINLDTDVAKIKVGQFILTFKNGVFQFMS